MESQASNILHRIAQLFEDPLEGLEYQRGKKRKPKELEEGEEESESAGSRTPLELAWFTVRESIHALAKEKDPIPIPKAEELLSVVREAITLSQEWVHKHLPGEAWETRKQDLEGMLPFLERADRVVAEMHETWSSASIQQDSAITPEEELLPVVDTSKMAFVKKLGNLADILARAWKLFKPKGQWTPRSFGRRDPKTGIRTVVPIGLTRDSIERAQYTAIVRKLERGDSPEDIVASWPEDIRNHCDKSFIGMLERLSEKNLQGNLFTRSNAKTGGLAITMPTVFTCGALREGGGTRSEKCEECCYADGGVMNTATSIWRSVMNYYMVHRYPDWKGMDDTKRGEWMDQLADRSFKQSLSYLASQEKKDVPPKDIDTYIRFSVAGDLTPRYLDLTNRIASKVETWERENGREGFFKPIIYSRSVESLEKMHPRIQRVLSLDRDLYSKVDWKSWRGARAWLMTGTWGEEKLTTAEGDVIPYEANEGAMIQDVNPDILFIPARGLGRTLPKDWLRKRACPENALPVTGAGYLHERACQNCAKANIFCFNPQAANLTARTPAEIQKPQKKAGGFRMRIGANLDRESTLEAAISLVKNRNVDGFVSLLQTVATTAPMMTVDVASVLSNDAPFAEAFVRKLSDSLSSPGEVDRLLDLLPTEIANDLVTTAVWNRDDMLLEETEEDAEVAGVVEGVIGVMQTELGNMLSRDSDVKEENETDSEEESLLLEEEDEWDTGSEDWEPEWEYDIQDNR